MPKRKVADPSEGGCCINPACHRVFSTKRGLTQHMERNPACAPIVKRILVAKYCLPTDTVDVKHHNNNNPGLLCIPAIVNPVQDAEVLESESTIEFPNDDNDELEDDNSSLSTLPDADDFGLPFAQAFTRPATTLRLPDAFIYTNATRTETDLLNTLLDIGAPLNGYQKIMKWAMKAHKEDYHFTPKHQTYHGVVRELHKSLESQHYQPYEIRVDLPTGKNHIDEIGVVVFDFVSQLHALLSDPRLNKVENLVLNSDAPFDMYLPPDGLLGEMMSGSWYRNAWSHMTQMNQKDFLIPIILYIDKTVLSSQSNKLSVYPINMSLGIFTEKARRNPMFWRPLGYIANELVEFSAMEQKEFKSDVKNQRLHNIIRGILRTYIAAQAPDQLNGINLQLGPHSKVVNLYIPLAFIIGDIEGGNQLSGYRGFSRMDCPRVSMTCDCSTENAANIRVTCNRIKQADVQQLVRNNDIAALHAMRQRPTNLAFFDVDCGNDPYGIFSMVMTEPLHSLESGLFPYIMDVLLHHIRGDTNRARLDRLIMEMARTPRQHGNAAFPRLRWRDGVTSLTNLTADQKTGKFFAIAMLSNTATGQAYFSEVLGSDDKWRDMNEVFQMLLCYWAWLKRPVFWRVGDHEIETQALEAIYTMIDKLTSLWPRATGNGWDLPKVHAQFHVPFNISRFGNQLNVHSGPQEANHIVLNKQPARNTQHRPDVLDYQIATRLAERLVIRQAYDIMHPPVIAPGFPSDPTVRATKGFLRLSRTSGNAFLQAYIDWDSEQYKRMLVPYFDDLIRLLIPIFEEHAYTRSDGSTSLSIPIFTEYQQNHTVYRAHNNFRSDGPWIDWCQVVTTVGTVPSQLVTFLLLPVVGIQAIVRSCKPESKEEFSVLTDIYEMPPCNIENVSPLQIVDMSALLDHVLMIPYSDMSLIEKWLLVHQREKWCDHFFPIY
jgi:hypothetical protein